MANEQLLRTNFMSGTITNNPLAAGGGTLSAAALANLAVVGATQFVRVILNPLGDTAYSVGPEIAWGTAHTAASTNLTILRGKEGTSGIQHATGCPFVISGPVVNDFITHTSVVQEFVASSGAAGFAATTYADMPMGTMTFTKRSALTALFVTAQFNGFTWNVSTPNSFTMGLSIAGTDYDLARCQLGTDPGSNAYTQCISGSRLIAAGVVAAGSITIKLRGKIGTVAGGATGLYSSTLSAGSFSVTECDESN